MEKKSVTKFDPAAYANFVIEGIATKIERAGREEGRTKALWLINHVTGVPFGDIAAKGIKPMIKEQWDALGEFLNRVIAGEPIQYIVGNTDFMGRVFKCDKRALIPRPETEELVAEVLAKAVRAQALRIVDVGTGTGCIAISLALALPEASVTATDISAAALALAKENASALNARVEFQQADVLAGIEPGSADIVVSNPPYIAEGEAASLASEIREHEPHSALFAGADGLDVIRRLAEESKTVLCAGGRLFLEIGETQADETKRLLVQNGYVEVASRKDLAGHDRIVQGRRPIN